MSTDPEPRDRAPELLAAVDGWRGAHPLARLRESLLAHQREGKLKRRRDVLAEAMVGRHLLAAGCDVAFEVPTPAGRTCDFRVSDGDRVFYLHVKRLAGRVRDRTLTISSRLRVLEQVRRPCTASIRWRPDADDAAMMRLVAEAERFLMRASIGDELIVREQPGGPEIGGVRIIGPGEGSRVTLVIGLPEGLGDAVPRVRRLMERAEAQFMPRAVNLVLIGVEVPADRELVREALLGSHEERWDAFPPRGRRVAVGRAADGFWSGSRHAESRVAGWFVFEPERPLSVELEFREVPAVDEEARRFIERSLLRPAAGRSSRA
jgi:hypothetical protein